MPVATLLLLQNESKMLSFALLQQQNTKRTETLIGGGELNHISLYCNVKHNTCIEIEL